MIWHKGNSPTGTQPVGRKTANAWGIYDMLGLTWEWCEDFYGPYPPGRVVDPLATAPGAGERPRRVLRGGSWLKDLASCRSATRYRNDPRSRNADNGFRLVTFDAAATIATPATAPALAEPKLEREDRIAVPQTEPARPLTAPGHHAAPSSKRRSVHLVPIIFLVFLFIVARAVQRFLKRGVRRDTSSESLRGSFQPTPPHVPSGELSTRVVEDGFWIQSSALPAGTLLTCRYTADEGSKEVNIHFDPGRDGHFVFTGSRPRAVSVVVVPRGSAAGMMLNDPASWQTPRRPDDDDDDHEKFRGFPRAY
jgi:hypothetical protein